MRYLFCKENSDSSRSVEHIIPQSLGNTEHVLPAGWVCDKCNNYFSREVEAPFLNSQYCKHARSEMLVANRRGRFPVVEAIHPQSRSIINIMRDEDGFVIFPSIDQTEKQFIDAIQSGKKGSIIIPTSDDPELSYDTARFIGKIAVEAFALRCMNIDGWNDELVDKNELDELRNYVRRRKPGFIWPIHLRRIYPADKTFSTDRIPSHEVLHEFDFLFIPATDHHPDAMEIYAIIAIFGIEYAINLAGPELDGYLQWLHDHNDQSYLYCRSESD